MPEILFGSHYIVPSGVACELCADFYVGGVASRVLSPYGRLLRDLMLSGF